MNIGLLILTIVGGAVGVFSVLYILISLPVTIIQKIYRKARFGISLFKCSAKNGTVPGQIVGFEEISEHITAARLKFQPDGSYFYQNSVLFPLFFCAKNNFFRCFRYCIFFL